MIKNGRPVTIEDSSDDTDLLNDLGYVKIKMIGEWISKNIRPANYVNGRTSYGIKHDLEKDIHLYMTNNQFKDAMLLAGYRPIDPNVVNWMFCIELIYEPYNHSPFIEWMKEFALSGECSGPVYDFITDVVNDENFPIFSEYDIILEYLENIRAIDEAVEAFKSVWELYQEDTKN